MEFTEVVQNRYSCRNFSSKQVTKAQLDAILEAGRVALTAKNLQEQRIYVAQSAEEFLTYTDLPKIVERNDSVLNSFIKDISKAQISDQTYIDTDLAVFIHKHNDIDTLVLGRNPNCSCELNSKHVCCPEAYLDIVEIVMKTDDEWRHRYINELKIMSKYYFSSKELQRVPGDRVRRLITAYDF